MSLCRVALRHTTSTRRLTFLHLMSKFLARLSAIYVAAFQLSLHAEPFEPRNRIMLRTLGSHPAGEILACFRATDTATLKLRLLAQKLKVCDWVVRNRDIVVVMASCASG